MENKQDHIDESLLGVPKKKSVIILILLCMITFGIYPYIWYIKRAKELDNLQTKSKSKKSFAIFSLVLFILIYLGLIGLSIYSTSSSIQPASSISDIPLVFLIILITLGCLILILGISILVLSFNYRKILNEVLENKGINVKVSALFTLFFHFLYLQYEINRIIKDTEEMKRIGPWIFFTLLVIIPALLFLILTLTSLI
jgi:hypothetical protein